MFYIRAKSKTGLVWARGLKPGIYAPAEWVDSAQAATPYHKETAKQIVRHCIALYDALELVPVAERPR